jgi:hypothetical protein
LGKCECSKGQEHPNGPVHSTGASTREYPAEDDFQPNQKGFLDLAILSLFARDWLVEIANAIEAGFPELPAARQADRP